MLKIDFDDSSYEYEHLEGLWEDIKAKLLKPIGEAIKPSVPEIIYRVIVPKQPETPAGQITIPAPAQIQVVEKPVIPTWVIPVGIGLVALLVVPRLIKSQQS